MANPWFRLYAEFATDPKVQMMSEALQRRYIMLLCLRCSNGNVTLQDEEIAFQLRISNDEWAATKQAMQEKCLITADCKPSAWDRRQFSSDSSDNRPSSEVWRAIRSKVFKRDDYACQYCGARGVKLECDHVFPVALGGGHEESNLATACFRCNRSKKNKTFAQWKSR
jgi:hypothetical protein